MKSNAIVRIVIYIVAIILLCCLLAAGIGLGSINFSLGIQEDLTPGSGSVEADLIQNLKIEWVAGEIILQTDPQVDTIAFTEKGSTADGHPMGFKIKGDTLLICYSNESKVQFGFTSRGSKDLIITVPANWICGELKIESVSTDATISNLTVDSIELDSASNHFVFNDCTIGSLDADGASNEIEITGNLERLDCDGMSAKITAVLTNTPSRIDLDGMSSKLELTLPFDCGFYVKMDGMSNHFSCDLETKVLDGAYVYGDRRCQITVDGMSSEVYISTHK